MTSGLADRPGQSERPDETDALEEGDELSDQEQDLHLGVSLNIQLWLPSAATLKGEFISQ